MMHTLLVMTFSNPQEVEQLQELLRRLHDIMPSAFDATFVSMHPEGVLQIVRLEASSDPSAPSAQALAQVAPDKEFARKVLDSLGPKGAVLFLVMGDDELCNGLLTTLLFLTPSAGSSIKREPGLKGEGQERRLLTQLNSYQAAVNALDALSADASEFERKQAFDIVDEAYNPLTGYLVAVYDEAGNEQSL